MNPNGFTTLEATNPKEAAAQFPQQQLPVLLMVNPHNTIEGHLFRIHQNHILPITVVELPTPVTECTGEQQITIDNTQINIQWNVIEGLE